MHSDPLSPFSLTVISLKPSEQRPLAKLSATSTALKASFVTHIDSLLPKTSRMPSLQIMRQTFRGLVSKRASLSAAAAPVGSLQWHFWSVGSRVASSMHLHSPFSNSTGSSEAQRVQSSSPWPPLPKKSHSPPCCLQALQV